MMSNDKDTLPPTELDVSDRRSQPANAHDTPTELEGQGSRRSPQQPPSPRQGDRTVLIGREKVEPTLAWLVITDGGPVGKIFTLNPQTTSIGRDPQNDITLDDEGCSRQHAKIRIERKGEGEDAETKVLLFDMASTNGTFVNDEQIYRQELADGDRVTVGETELVFKAV